MLDKKVDEELKWSKNHFALRSGFLAEIDLKLDLNILNIFHVLHLDIPFEVYAGVRSAKLTPEEQQKIVSSMLDRVKTLIFLNHSDRLRFIMVKVRG